MSRQSKEMVLRYRKSLLLLVNPFAESVKDDGVQKVMTAKELQCYTNLCCSVLHLLDIPFHDMRETEFSARVQMLW